MRDGFRCTYCGKTSSQKELEVDHIIAKCRGGSDDLENLTTACYDCNQGKSAQLLIDPENLNSDLSTLIQKSENNFKEKFPKLDLDEIKLKEKALMFCFYLVLKVNSPKLEAKSRDLVVSRMSCLIRKHHPLYLFRAIDWAVDKYIPKQPDMSNVYKVLGSLDAVATKIRQVMEENNKTKEDSKID